MLSITWLTCQDAPILGLHRTYGRLTVAYPYAAVERVVFYIYDFWTSTEKEAFTMVAGSRR